MKLSKTNDSELSRARALVYGDSGIGKTTSLKTLPVEGTTIATCERSVLPLREYGFNVFVVEEWDDVREVYKMLRQPAKVEDEAFRRVAEQTKVLAIDSLSAVSDLLKQHIIKKSRPAMLKERTKGKSDTPSGVYDDAMTQEDWGAYRTRLLNLISAFCHLPIDFIATALADVGKDLNGSPVWLLPNFPGKAGRESLQFFDQVLYMRNMPDADGKDTRVWQTACDGMVRAKDAAGVLDKFEETNWTELFAKIHVKEAANAEAK